MRLQFRLWFNKVIIFVFKWNEKENFNNYEFLIILKLKVDIKDDILIKINYSYEKTFGYYNYTAELKLEYCSLRFGIILSSI